MFSGTILDVNPFCGNSKPNISMGLKFLIIAFLTAAYFEPIYSTKILVIKEIDDAQSNLPIRKLDVTEIYVTLDRGNAIKSWNKVVSALKGGVSLIVDMTWAGWSRLRRTAQRRSLAYLSIDRSIGQLLNVAAVIMESVRNTTDAALIFQQKIHMDQSLLFLMRRQNWHAVLLHGLTENSIRKLNSMTPIPSVYIIFASSSKMNDLYNMAVSRDLAQTDDRWQLVFTDFEDKFNRSQLRRRTALVTPDGDGYCDQIAQSHHACNITNYEQLMKLFLKEAVMCLEDTLVELMEDEFDPPESRESSINESLHSSPIQISENKFNSVYSKNSLLYPSIVYWGDRRRGVTPNLEFSINSTTKDGANFTGTWSSSEGLDWAHGMHPVKRFFRIGTGITEPFAIPRINTATGAEELDENNETTYAGYCIDFINKLAHEMNFDYKLVATSVYGARINGTWNGLVGLLVDSKVDIVVASLTMNSEREEFIDFVTPYFLQSGFVIVMRKKAEATKMFKFLSVLKGEVWLTILGVIAITTLVITFIEHYSPYSGKNFRKWRNRPCRHFTLKESFWFSLTSFTPAGGGEAPKSLSAKLLVGSYWIFVALMVSTFIANLAAFLTVERMQTPIQSLDELSKQTFVKYTVVNGGDAYNYFSNMKNAEEILFSLWKNQTIMAKHSDISQYRVWDYPVKERYNDIFNDIENATPVSSAEEGFNKVLEHEQSDFAFIHDALEIKYRVFRNCHLTVVGDTFAEQPYSVAVQKGSHLNEELSRKILQLQKEKFFEKLAETYWNNSQHGEKCKSTNRNDGTSIESLGGVFIATYFGVIVALITLSTEMLSQKKKNLSGGMESNNGQTMIYDEILTKREFGTEGLKFKKSVLLPSIQNCGTQFY